MAKLFSDREIRAIAVFLPLAGLLIVGVGVLFWTTNGLVGAPELVPLDAQAWLQENTAILANPILDFVMSQKQMVVATTFFPAASSVFVSASISGWRSIGTRWWRSTSQRSTSSADMRLPTRSFGP